MKEFFGTDFSPYDAVGLGGIQSALRCELRLYRLYIAWNIFFMLAGCVYVYFNHQLFTTNEMLRILAAFWAASGLPFFLLRDFALGRFAGVLPRQTDESGRSPFPAPLLSAVKALAGLFFGSWGTHVMLISACAKYFELKGYEKLLQAARAT